MPGYELRERIDRPLSEVFDFVGTHQSDKHPHWEPEVISIRKVTDSPIRRGTQAVMIRKDFSLAA